MSGDADGEDRPPSYLGVFDRPNFWGVSTGFSFTFHLASMCLEEQNSDPWFKNLKVDSISRVRIP